MSPAVLLCASLVVWVAVLLVQRTESCMETAWSSGHLAQDLRSFTLESSQASSCLCCAVCYGHKECASLSYNEKTRQCRLYDSVANYSTLTPDQEWKYFVLPGWSQHQQFCRWDSDCQEEGDFCRGRVCTKLTAVTCRVIYETFGAGQRFGETIDRMYGWLNGTEVPLACRMGSKYRGFTRLLQNRNQFKELNRDTFMEYNTALDPSVTPHSILFLAEHIRLAGNDITYRIKVFRCDQKFMVEFEMPREEPVLSDKPRPDVGNPTDSSVPSICKVTYKLSPPYLPGNGSTMLTINADNFTAVKGAIVRDDGIISSDACGVTRLLVYIQE